MKTLPFALALSLPMACLAADGGSESFLATARALRQASLDKLFGPPLMAVSRPVEQVPFFRSSYPWRCDITSTVFWIGEPAAPGSPSNARSSYDPRWVQNFGGIDSPDRRSGLLPANFIPRQNPYYTALPVCDVINGRTVAEAAAWIPWFKAQFKQDGVSVLKGRWVAIRHEGRTCYAQIEDAGPYHVDDWAFVFGGSPPRPHANNDAGIDVSPSVRDYLQLKGLDRVDFRFIEAWEVPEGPWISISRTVATL